MAVPGTELRDSTRTGQEKINGDVQLGPSMVFWKKHLGKKENGLSESIQRRRERGIPAQGGVRGIREMKARKDAKEVFAQRGAGKAGGRRASENKKEGPRTNCKRCV